MNKRKIQVYGNITFGDWVHCIYCDTSMLVPVGTEICPCCGCAVGSLSWLDENEDIQEVSLDDLERNNNYEIEYKNTLL